MDVIDQVILVGAGTRVPKVQEALVTAYGRELGKSLNTDEAAAMGAVYKAADLSTGFKVKKFLTKDAVIFPILVDFEREIENEGSNTKTIKIIRRTLFAPMNPYPQKKILTFNKHVSDFTFYVSYGDLPVPAHEALAVGSPNITKVELSGVAAAIEKHKAEGVECKGVKAHFSMDESGIFSLSQVEIVFEKNSTEPDASEDTLSKLGSAFSSLFSGSSEAESSTPKPEDDQTNGEEQKADAEPADNGNASSSDGQKQNATVNQTEADAAKQNATATPKKPKVVVIKENLDLVSHNLDVPTLDGSKLTASATKLNALNEADKKRALTERSRNTLEAFVLDMANKIYSSEYESYVTEEEREKIGKACQEISDWLYEDGSNADREVYDEKFKSLKLMTKEVEDRVREHKDRPDALDALDKMINISKGFLDSSKNVPEDQQYFTDVEVATLDKLLTETLEWRAKKLKEQEQTPLTKTPALTVRMIAEKLDALDREVKYMVNKARVNKLKKQREEETKAKEAPEPSSTGEEPPKDKDNVIPESTGESNAEAEPKEGDAQQKNESGSSSDGQNETEKVNPTETDKSDKSSHSEL
jgi:hypoxia up-regulated 1